MADFKKFNNPKFLLQTKDINGEQPEIFIDCQNRGSGKTYGYCYGLLEQALGRDMGWGLPLGKFMLLCRWKTEVGSICNGMFADVVSHEYENGHLGCTLMNGGLYANITFSQGEEEPVHVGYVCPINKADDLKKISSLFHDTAVMIMDEFQCASATSYCTDEVDKFIRLHISVARGGGKSSRFVPVILLSNSISILNPYFTALGIHNKVQSNTKKLKGDGYVLQRIINPNAAAEQRESKFNRAFGNTKELDSSIDNAWLADDTSCIEKPDETWGRSIYYWTLVSDNKKFGVRYFPAMDYYTINHSIDGSCQTQFNISINGNLNVPLLKNNPQMKYMRDAFTGGRMRFPDQECKAIALSLFV